MKFKIIWFIVVSAVSISSLIVSIIADSKAEASLKLTAGLIQTQTSLDQPRASLSRSEQSLEEDCESLLAAEKSSEELYKSFNDVEDSFADYYFSLILDYPDELLILDRIEKGKCLVEYKLQVNGKIVSGICDFSFFTKEHVDCYIP